jgi:POT family proton-dependent oligopeptide transporter
MVGQLYPEGDVRKDGAYSIFYMGINAGAFFAPLVCGYLGENVDFKWGFFSAGIGMIIGLIIFYLTKNKYVISPTGKQLGVAANKLDDTSNADGGFSTQQLTILIGGIVAAVAILFYVLKVDFWGSLIYGMTLVAPFVVITDKSLTKTEKDRLWVIILVMIFVVFFWMCFEQAGASLTFFADEQTDRKIFGWTMPASYFQSFNAGFIVLLAPILSVIWLRLNKVGKNPAAPFKQGMGLGFLALGYLFIALGAKNIPTAGASIIWLTGLYFLHTVGELCLSPIGLSMVNKLTPARFTSLMMGVWFLAIATGNKLAGTMSSLYPEQQNVAAEFNASKVTLNGQTVNWDSVANKHAIAADNIWEVQLVKKSEASKKPDSIANIIVTPFTASLGADTTKVKRIIPSAMSEEKKKKIFEKFGDKEPKFIFAKGKDANTYYLLRNEMYAKNNEIKLEQWNTNPEHPKFLGIEITDLYTYFMLFVGLSGIASLILLLLAGRLQKMMHGVK